MKKILFYILLGISFVNVAAQNRAPNEGQVFYYKQIEVVKNGKKSAGDNTGQFITFTHAGCYDSTKDRQSVGNHGGSNDIMKYQGLKDNVYIYYGRSYWGNESNYYFFNNFDRLNVHAPDGVVYVYEKIAAPAGVLTSAKIYVKAPEPKPVGPTPSIIDNNPINPVVVNPGPVNPVNPVNTWDPTPQKTTTKCHSCKGSGNCQSCAGTGKCASSSGRLHCQNGYTKCSVYSCNYGYVDGRRCGACNGAGRTICGICRGSGNCGVCHGNGKCLGCRGTGYYN
jgi:hypothetical protein